MVVMVVEDVSLQGIGGFRLEVLWLMVNKDRHTNLNLHIISKSLQGTVYSIIILTMINQSPGNVSMDFPRHKQKLDHRKE